MNVDGMDYGILEDAAKEARGIPGLSCEIGLRGGGGTQYMIDGLIGKTINKQPIRTHIAIDPYGGMPYYEMEKKLREDGPYTNHMMKEALANLYLYVQKKPINFLFFPMEDTEFFKRFENGVPVYEEGVKKTVNEYAIVYFDGPHTVQATLEETYFFHERTKKGAMFVYDDVSKHYYDHNKVREFLLANEWNEVKKTHHKAAYRKICDISIGA